MARKRLIHAANEALFEEMERDEKIILFGEDVEISMFGDTVGLHKKFGSDRVRNTPISEATIAGMAIGAATSGYLPILHMNFSNFIYTGFDAIANQMAKLQLMTNGQIELPITVIAGMGGGRSTAAQHSDTPYPLLMNIGGVEVVTPATPEDAKGLLKSAIRSDNPTFYLEPGGRGGESGEVPDEDYVTPLGQAAILNEGEDVTIITMGSMVKPSLRAADKLEKDGLSVEVVDCRSLVPLDTETLLNSVRKTGRLVVVDEARDMCSAASHIAAVAAEQAFEALSAPIQRVTVPDVSMPYAPPVEKFLLPDVTKITQAVQKIAP